MIVSTDGQGEARTNWRLGSRSGAASDRVRASAAGFEGQVEFTASALPTSPAQIVPDGGNNQSGRVGEILPLPLNVVVTDAGHNRLEGVPVTFTVVAGGGSIEGAASFLAVTDGHGLAQAFVRLGSDEGLDNNIVEADFAGNPNRSVTFVASGKLAGDPGATAVSGIVLDNTNQPIVGVTVALEDTGLSAATDVQGRFLLEPAPVGMVRLLVDGSTAQRPGQWPSLNFDFHTVPGQNNSLARPIYLLALDTENGLAVSESQGGTLTMPEFPGFALEIAPGSALFPDGTRSGTVTVTSVHSDKVPMVPGLGMQPRFIVTVQPAGVRFDPPARLAFPNFEGRPAGQKTEMYSFDHDLGQFISIGTASVSDDGLLIQSDPGVGLLKGGWHCAGDPTPLGGAENAGAQLLGPDRILLSSDESRSLSAVGRPEPGTYQWTSSDPSVVDFTSPTSGAGVSTVSVQALSAGAAEITVRFNCRSSATAEDTLKIIVSDVEIMVEAIDQDDPENAQFQQVNEDPPVVYGGSQDSTSDDLKLTAMVEAEQGMVQKYTWTVEGEGSASYAPPSPSPQASQWEVGEVNPTPGKLTFRVKVEFEGGEMEGVKEVEVGIRTDDVAVIGWIDPNGVTLNSDGIDLSVSQIFPSEGYDPGVGDPSRLATLLYLGKLAHLFQFSDLIPRPDDSCCLNSAEREWILNWMFKYAANSCERDECPPMSFESNSDLDQFTVNRKRSYKLLNRLQIKFRVDDGKFLEAPTVLQKEAEIGVTSDPVMHFDSPGRAGPNNRVMRVLTALIDNINDGTPEADAVLVFNRLAVDILDTPVIWNNIGSRIEMGVLHGTGREIFLQVYPTFSIFDNLNRKAVRPQAPRPIDNFNSTPYPPGPAPFIPEGGS